jgi:hypothetical protein
MIVRSLYHHSHLVVILLAEQVQIQAADDAQMLVQVAFRVEISTKTGPNMRDCVEPLPLARVWLALTIHDSDLDIRSVAVGQ